MPDYIPTEIYRGRDYRNSGELWSEFMSEVQAFAFNEIIYDWSPPELGYESYTIEDEWKELWRNVIRFSGSTISSENTYTAGTFTIKITGTPTIDLDDTELILVPFSGSGYGIADWDEFEKTAFSDQVDYAGTSTDDTLTFTLNQNALDYINDAAAGGNVQFGIMSVSDFSGTEPTWVSGQANQIKYYTHIDSTESNKPILSLSSAGEAPQPYTVVGLGTLVGVDSITL